MQIYWLILGILSVWRVAHMLYGEDGPWNIFVKFRALVGNGFWGSLLDCFYCLSIWVAVPVALVIGEGWEEIIFLWLATSAGAILLERCTTTGLNTPPEAHSETKEQ